MPHAIATLIYSHLTAATKTSLKMNLDKFENLCHERVSYVKLLRNSSFCSPVQRRPHLINLRLIALTITTQLPAGLKSSWIQLPSLGKYRTKLTRSNFNSSTENNRPNSFVSLKDPTPQKYRSSVVYEF